MNDAKQDALTGEGRQSRLRQVRIGLSIIPILLGSAALLGWFLGQPDLRRILSEGSEVKPNTAICLILLGIGLLLRQGRSDSKWSRVYSRCAAAFVATIAALTIIQYWFNINLGIDELLFKDVANPVGTSHPGRMSQPTAWNFIFAASAITLLNSKRAKKWHAIQWLALAIALVPIDIVLSYLYGNMNLLAFGKHPSYMALPTAVSFLSIAIALLLHEPDIGIVRALTAPTKASARSRAFLLALMLAPPFVGWVVLKILGGEQNPPAFGVSLTVMLCMLVLVALTWVNAARANKAEELLRTQSRRLEVLNEVAMVLAAELDLEKILQATTDAGRELSGAGFGAFFNTEQKVSICLQSLSGVSRETFEKLLLPRYKELFNAALHEKRVVRVADVLRDPRHGTNATLQSLPPEQWPLRSYMALPVVSRGGTLLGGLFFGHWEPAAFTQESEKLVSAIAGGAAIAIENSKLYGALQKEVELQKTAALANNRLAAVVESSDDAIITKDLNGIITTWNHGAQQLFGYTAEEVLGKPVTILIPADRQDEEPGILSKLRQGHRIDHYETVRQCKDGTLIDVSLTVSPLRNADGKIIGASKIARNITEQKQAREALTRSHEELEKRVAERTASLTEAIAQMEEFSYSVSHDLRAPVRAMQGYAQATLEDYGHVLDKQGHEYLNHIVRSGERMDRLVRELLVYSRIARADLQLQPVSLDQLVRDIVSHYPEMQQPKAEIITRGELHSVIAHEPSLTQAISNLLNNAVKFVAPGVKPEVELYSERQGDRLRLWVHDNGIGIRPEYRTRLFGLFERIHNGKQYEGTGIGLAIVRKSVERMGGKVGMESNGNGSKFWIELPSAEVDS